MRGSRSDIGFFSPLYSGPFQLKGFPLFALGFQNILHVSIPVWYLVFYWDYSRNTGICMVPLLCRAVENKFCSCCSPWFDHLVELLLVVGFFCPVPSRLWQRTCCVMFLSFNSCFVGFFGGVYLRQSPSSVKLCQTYSEFLSFLPFWRWPYRKKINVRNIFLIWCFHGSL